MRKSPTYLTDGQKAQIIDLYMSNDMSTGEIAVVVKCNRTAAKEHLRRKGILRSNSEAQKLSFKRGASSSFKNKAKNIINFKTTLRNHPGKAHHGEDHPRWIKDRSKLKNRRSQFEEKEFFKEVLKARNYTCELTGYTGVMSVHHKKLVCQHPTLQFDKSNVIVVLAKIHKLFHNTYGYQWANEDKWNKFVTNKEYLAVR